MSSALHAAALRTWNGLNEVFHDLLCSMWCNEMCYVTTAPVLQPRIRRWWHRGKVPGRKSVEHECSWLSMQLWKTSTERMPVKSRHSHSGKHHGYDANCAVFFSNMSTNHKFDHIFDCAKLINKTCANKKNWTWNRTWLTMSLIRYAGATRVANIICHAKRWYMWVCATPATQNDGRCQFVPRLPRKVPRRHGRLNQDQARHPVPSVPRLPRKTMVDVSLCHACQRKTTVDVSLCRACHAKCRGVTGD